MSEIVSNLRSIQHRMAAACERVGRDSSEVKLLLAIKTVTPDKIKEVLRADPNLLVGENKVQELKEKFDALKGVSHEAHFIGHLQTNKIKEVLKYVDCIQSIDRLSLAEKLQKRLEFENRCIDAFIQVNTSYEQSKFGIAPEEALDFALKVANFDRIRLKGLMTIGLFSSNEDEVRKCFRLLKNLQEEMLSHNLPVHELSMGMSNDFGTAIEEGATIVRVGTAIFGQRQYPDSYYWNESIG